jgi:hypothetical protein
MRREEKKERVNIRMWMTFMLDSATYYLHLHLVDIDALRLSKRNYTVCVLVCVYVLLFLIASSSLSLTTRRYIQRGLYNQGKNRIIGNILCSYSLSYSSYNNIAFFLYLDWLFFCTHPFPDINGVRIKSR